MNRHSEQPDGRPDPLDRLLAEARWAEPTRKTVGDLQDQWRCLVVKRARRRRQLFALAAAAVLAAVAGTVCFVTSHSGASRLPPTSHTAGQACSGTRRVAVKTSSDMVDHVVSGTAGQAGSGTQDISQTPSEHKGSSSSTASNIAQTSRPPNLYERVAFVAHRRTQRAKLIEAAEEELALCNAFEEVTAQPNCDVREVAQRLVAERPDAEVSLAAQADELSGERQTAAVRLWAEIATARTSAALQRFADVPVFKADVFRGAARLSDSPTLARRVREEQEPAVRRQLLAVLLSRGDIQSVGIFLDNVNDPEKSADALDCLANVSDPPIAALFQCLSGSSVGRRTAAAWVLGRLDQPAVSQQLIAMIARGLYRQEAMIGLLSSSEETARQFVADAARDPMLSATLLNAQRQFHRLSRGGVDHATSHESS